MLMLLCSGEVATLCVEPLDKFYGVGIEQCKESREQMTKLNAGLNDWKIQIAKARHSCNTLVRAVLLARLTSNVQAFQLQDLSEKKRQAEEKKEKEQKGAHTFLTAHAVSAS